MGYGLDVREFSGEARDFSLLHSVQHPASYPKDTRGFSGRDVKLTTHLHLVPRSRMM
jgi:hypothetical protein